MRLSMDIFTSIFGGGGGNDVGGVKGTKLVCDRVGEQGKNYRQG